MKWGIAWRTPTFMAISAISGFILAIEHHLYFLSLNRTIAGSPLRRQWPMRFGSAFSFLVIALLKITCDTAYSQYTWILFKQQTSSLNTIDRLFALTTDVTAFFSLDISRSVKFAAFLALTCWFVTLQIEQLMHPYQALQIGV